MFFGITRFSLFLPNSTAWYLSKDTVDNELKIQAYKDKLFSSSRLEERIDIFFNISLPTLLRMKKNYQYYHILQISDEMPTHYKKIIKQSCEKYSFVILQEVDRYGHSQKTLEKIILDKLQGRKRCFGLFSLDDDDVLSIDYFDKANIYIDDKFKGHVASFGTGITGLLTQGNIVKEPRVCYEPKINIGLLRICWINNNKVHIPALGNHKYVDKFSPTLLDSREIMYYWCKHLNQDSSRSFNDKQHQMNLILADLEKCEKISIDEFLKNKFPLLNFKTEEELTTVINHDIETTLNKDLLLNFNKINGKISIEFNVNIENFLNVVDANRALIASFEFADEPDVVATLSKSQDRDIGFFKYIALYPQSNIAKLEFFIPEQLALKTIRLRKWKMRTNIKITNIVIKIKDF